MRKKIQRLVAGVLRGHSFCIRSHETSTIRQHVFLALPRYFPETSAVRKRVPKRPLSEMTLDFAYRWAHGLVAQCIFGQQIAAGCEYHPTRPPIRRLTPSHRVKHGTASVGACLSYAVRCKIVLSAAAGKARMHPAGASFCLGEKCAHGAKPCVLFASNGSFLTLEEQSSWSSSKMSLVNFKAHVDRVQNVHGHIECRGRMMKTSKTRKIHKPHYSPENFTAIQALRKDDLWNSKNGSLHGVSFMPGTADLQKFALMQKRSDGIWASTTNGSMRGNLRSKRRRTAHAAYRTRRGRCGSRLRSASK